MHDRHVGRPRIQPPQVPARDAVRIGRDLLRRAGGDDAPAAFAAARPHVDHPVGVGDHVEVVFDDHDGRAGRHESVEHAEQHPHIERMQANGRLVEHEHGVRLSPAHFAGKLQALRLTARKRRRRLAERQVAQTQIVQRGQSRMHLAHVAGHGQRLIHAHRHQLRQGEFAPVLGRAVNRVGFGRIPGAPAVGAFDVDVGQELHIERNRTGAVACRAAQSAGVVGEVAGLPTARLGFVASGEGAAQVVVDVGVGGHGGTHVRADRRGVDEVRALDAVGVDRAHMLGRLLPRRPCLERGNQRFEHHRGFAGAGYAGHRHQTAARNINIQRLDRMQLTGCHANMPKVEHMRDGHAPAFTDTFAIGQERRDAAARIRRHVADRALRDHMLRHRRPDPFQ